MDSLIIKWNNIVSLHKEQDAICFENRSFSYDEINKWIDQIASIIGNLSKHDVVGVMMGNSVEYVVSILAALKANRGFVPIDVDYPESRKKIIIDECKLDMVLYKEGAEIKPHIIDRDSKTKLGKNDIAYIMYTSGTTGKPKGIMISPQSLENLIEWFGSYYQIDYTSKIAQLAKCTFDVSIEEIFGCLFNGGTLYIPSQSIKTHVEEMREFIRKNDINMVQGVPLMIKEHFAGKEKIHCLRTIISGGEALSEELKNEIVSRGYILYNNYGPTETTVDALSSRCSLHEQVNLGVSILNSEYVVLDESNHRVEGGTVGELCISGKNVAIGYIDSEENDKKFCSYAGKRIYKTGDLVKIENGLLLFVGRRDSQVKIFGHRIELEEIERTFCRITGIQYCGAVVVSSGYITVFYESEIDIDLDYVVARFKEILPRYMIPSSIVRCDELPVTDCGKINRYKLELLTCTSINCHENIVTSNEKLNEIEHTILRYARNVIEDESIEIRLNTELLAVGMNSISFVTMIIAIEDEFDIEFDVDTLLSDFKTFGDISDYVSKMVQDNYKKSV